MRFGPMVALAGLAGMVLERALVERAAVLAGVVELQKLMR
jgi:hypothetical protein